MPSPNIHDAFPPALSRTTSTCYQQYTHNPFPPNTIHPLKPPQLTNPPTQNLAHTITHPTQHPYLSAETHATDSHQNLLLSIIHFHHLTSRYPTHITLITHAFKLSRFHDIHVPAIRWPSHRIRLIGIDPPEHVTLRAVLEKGERERGYGVWRGDVYGVGEMLGRKRAVRGWIEGMEAVVGVGEGEGVRELLGWRGGESGVEIYPGRLPWDEG